MLRFSDYSYADIAEYFGFSSQSHFIQCFQKCYACTPAEFRKRYFQKTFTVPPTPKLPEKQTKKYPDDNGATRKRRNNRK